MRLRQHRCVHFGACQLRPCICNPPCNWRATTENTVATSFLIVSNRLHCQLALLCFVRLFSLRNRI